MNIRRWDGMVHTVRTIEHYGDVLRNSPCEVARLVCGRAAKLYDGGHNRRTEDAPTCLFCITESEL
jgi:hypothetical protein